jgi:outer membrane protein assembly factor BamB
MKFKIIFLSISLLLLSSILSACAGAASAANSWPGLITDGETAYLAFQNHVYAIQVENGVEKWRFPGEADRNMTFFADPELDPNGQLIIGSYDNVLYSVNSENGNKNWEFAQAQNRYIGGALATDDGIFAPNTNNRMFALTLEGGLRWILETSNPNWAKPATDNQCECIYLASMDHSLYSINPENGQVNWNSGELGGALVGTPAISEDGKTIYVGTFGNEMIAISAETGNVIWRAPTAKDNGWVWSGPALSEDRLYFGDLNGNFYALDATNGTPVWELPAENLDGPISGTPLVLEDSIYFGTEDGTFYAVNKEGTPIWSQTIDGKLFTSPTAAGDLILVASTNAENLLNAFTSDGAKRWTFAPAE